MHNRLCDCVPVARREGEPIQFAKGFDPPDSPSKIGVVVDLAQGAERQVGLRPGQIVEFATMASVSIQIEYPRSNANTWARE